MKKLLLLLLLSIGLIGTASAVGGYKCSPNEAYELSDDGILIKDKDFPVSYAGRGFTIDRKTGRFLGGEGGMKGGGETFTVLHQGDKDSAFKAYYAEEQSSWSWLLSITIKEYSNSYEKPFLYSTFPMFTVYTGTCINY
tara:strand:+ start:32 stop:448 length:417 start_codon:yes stop_codon:yes gene_type:complete